ncbi:hypothetical protein L6258_01830 [Candidatus Parcubacteria bacterium]|nr:hypothetical protein [Candidatus Parcubacteria bacterium]
MARNLAREARQEFHRLEWIRNKFFDVVALAVWKIPRDGVEIRILWLQKRSWWSVESIGEFFEWAFLPKQAISVGRLRLGASRAFARDATQGGTVKRVVEVTSNDDKLWGDSSSLGAAVIREIVRRIGRIDQLSALFLAGWLEDPLRS